MFLSPFSEFISYNMPDGKGVYVLPTSEAAPSGWGEPRWQPATDTQEATAIIPGTVGGAFPVTLLRLKSGTWKAASLKQFQKAGNITWIGDYRSPGRPSKGKYVLSYAGPKLRYFREEAFVYGSSAAHSEVYYLGAIAAISPGPVLGACLTKQDWFDVTTQTTENTQFLIVAVVKDGKDIFYRRRWQGTTIQPAKLTDAVREAEVRMFHPVEAPFGWMLMGEVPTVDNAYSPETPWFFNKSGTAAATMRRKTITFDNGNGTTTEDFYNRYKVTIANGTISFSNAGNAEPMQYKEKHVKEQVKDYVSTDAEGYTHTWDEDIVKVQITLTGEHYVMCDYRDDTLIYGKLKYNMLRVQEEYYTTGTDPLGYVDDNDEPISNQSFATYYGPYYYDIVRYGFIDPAYAIAPGDHNWTTWINLQESVTLYYGAEGNDETDSVELHQYMSGTSDEWAGNPRQSNNPYFYFYFFSTRWMQAFANFREHMGFLAYDFTKYGLYRAAATYDAAERAAIYDRTEKHKTARYSDTELKGTDLKSTKKASSGIIEFGWTRADMLSWDATFSVELARTTYEGWWSTDNASGAIQKPGSRSFYDGDETGDMTEGWPSIPALLYGDETVCKGNGVVTETGVIAYSVEVPDQENEGSYVVLSGIASAGSLNSVVGFGTKFYPVGTC